MFYYLHVLGIAMRDMCPVIFLSPVLAGTVELLHAASDECKAMHWLKVRKWAVKRCASEAEG